MVRRTSSGGRWAGASTTTGRGRAAGPRRRTRRGRPSPSGAASTEEPRPATKRHHRGARLGPVPAGPGGPRPGQGVEPGHLGHPTLVRRSSSPAAGPVGPRAGSSVTRSAGMSTTAVVPAGLAGRSWTRTPCRAASRATTKWPSRALSAGSNSGDRASSRLASSMARDGHAQPPVGDLDGVPVRHDLPGDVDPGAGRGEGGGVLDQLGEQVDHVADGPAQHAGRLHCADVHPVVRLDLGDRAADHVDRRRPGSASPGRAPRRRG